MNDKENSILERKEDIMRKMGVWTTKRQPYKRVSPPLCPKCKGKAVAFTEMVADEFPATTEGWPDRENGVSNIGGTSVGVYATCEIGHRWRVYGATQITDIEKPD